MKLTPTLIGGLLALAWPNAPNVDISPEDPSIPLIRRNQSRGTSLFHSQNYPVRSGLASQFFSAGDLSAHDKLFLASQYPFVYQPAIQWSDKESQHALGIAPYLFGQFLDSGTTQILGGPGLRLDGNLSERLTFYSNGHVFTEVSDSAQYNHQFDPEFGETCSVENNGTQLVDTRTCNRYEYYLLFDLARISFKFGHDKLHMGPGYFSTLTADSKAPPFYLAEIRVDFAPWLTLDNYFLRMTDGDHRVRKWANIHRFEFKLWNSLSLAFQDIVIYHSRDPDFRYLIPLVPLAFSEDNTGGLDNDGLSFDFLFAGLPFVSLWGEFFIDDLQGPTTLFDDFWENRWAALAGFQIISPWQVLDVDLVVEYSRVEPWTYVGRDSLSSFRHFNGSSASKLGPDSRSLDILLSFRPWRGLELREYYQWNEKGLGDGSVLNLPHNDGVHGTRKTFLAGPTDNRHLLNHGLSFFWSRFLRMEFSLTQAIKPELDLGWSGGLSLIW